MDINNLPRKITVTKLVEYEIELSQDEIREWLIDGDYEDFEIEEMSAQDLMDEMAMYDDLDDRAFEFIDIEYKVSDVEFDVDS